MSTHTKFNPARRSRWLSAAAAAALLVAAAVGITTLRYNTAHAVHPAAAANVAAGLSARLLPGTLAVALPDAWQAPASDASLPSAHEVFKGRAAPDSEGSAPTF